jgi:hypothetical protein
MVEIISFLFYWFVLPRHQTRRSFTGKWLNHLQSFFEDSWKPESIATKSTVCNPTVNASQVGQPTCPLPGYVLRLLRKAYISPDTIFNKFKIMAARYRKSVG